MEVLAATSAEDLADLRSLFREYAAGIGIDLGFQAFEEELAGLPGKYAPPGGLLLARRGAEPVGCIAFRPLDAGRCELKRLYVRPCARDLGLGHRLVSCAMERARRAGFTRVALDTILSLTSALRLYASLGFTDIEPYCSNPVPGARFLGRDLA